ncbi:hypothetical protein Tco_1204061 [Tanacetum coccineum]
MSGDNSTEIDIPNVEPVEEVEDAFITPKFDMHIITSTLGEKTDEWIAKTYGIPLDLHPRPAPEGMTMDESPDDAIHFLKKWKHRFFLVDRRAAPIAMPWGNNDSSIVDMWKT